MIDYSRGSEWRRWDLHLHTASSYDYSYRGPDADEKLCEALRNNGIAAVAITDHFIIDKNRITHLKSLCEDITFFPGVELRTDKGGKNLHVILIFPETSNLDTLSNDFDSMMIRGNKGLKGESISNLSADEIRANFHDRIHWDYQAIVDFAHERNAIISIHAGKKTNGIDSEVTQALPYRDAVKDEIARSVNIFEVGNPKDIDVYKTKVLSELDNRPVIICSDNHNPNNLQYEEKLWIKANCTFEGLRQCVIQPEERVYVGDLPPELKRLKNNSLSTLKSLEVHPIDDAKRVSSNWFNFYLQLNPGLVAIIGNKGSGKSALSDILGLLCNSKNINSASFLNTKRFKKTPNEYSKDYNAKITWFDNNTVEKNLHENYDENNLENACYLPQSYIEEICNTLDDRFQKEIDNLIFSHIDENEKGQAEDLTSFLDWRSRMLEISLPKYKEELHDLNKKIIHLENLRTTKYKAKISEGIKDKNDRLRRLLGTKPKRVQEGQSSDMQYEQKIEEISSEENKLHVAKKKSGDRIQEINDMRTSIDCVLAKISDW